ncbi:MinD/ParA family protein [Zavarzinia sp. CC-PAN008]|uniref:MinD/ParA family protein n=1 Tax=Zavarzinia sp. CC-PAN008 TaxID=3243332 RepID=UPI003F7496EF
MSFDRDARIQPPRPAPAAPLTAARRLITVASGKGGVGKTWLAVTLAHAMALKGQRVLLFDGDLGLANVDIQLGLTPQHDLGSVISGRIALEQAVTRVEEGGFDVLAGKSGSGALAGLGRAEVAQIRDGLVGAAQHYDRVIIDLGAGIDPAMVMLAHHPGIVLIVTTDEPTSITDAYAFIKLGLGRSPRADMRLVVNMAANRNEGLRTYETLKKACEGFLKYTPPLAGIVRRDAKVRDAIRNQTSLLTRSPTAEAADDVDVLARSLALPG